MPQYKYVGPKVYRRQVPPADVPPPPTVEEVHPGDVVDELSAAEVAAFGDRFVVVGEEGTTAAAYALEHPHEEPARTATPRARVETPAGPQTRTRHE